MPQTRQLHVAQLATNAIAARDCQAGQRAQKAVSNCGIGSYIPQQIQNLAHKSANKPSVLVRVQYKTDPEVESVELAQADVLLVQMTSAAVCRSNASPHNISLHSISLHHLTKL